MEEHEHIARFEAYESGNCSESERLAMEEQLASDLAFARNYENFRMARVLMKQDHHHDVREMIERAGKQHQRSKTMIYKVAAVLLLLLVSGYLLLSLQYTPDALVADYFEPYPDRVSVMGSAQDSQTLEDAMRAYKLKDYPEVVSLLNGNPQTDEASLYLGVSFVALGEWQQGIDILKPLNRNDFEYRGAARWNLALAYLGLEDTNSCIAQLEAIVAEGEVAYQYDSAVALLADLNSIFF